MTALSDLESLAVHAGDELEGASALDILTWAASSSARRGASPRRWPTRCCRTWRRARARRRRALPRHRLSLRRDDRHARRGRRDAAGDVRTITAGADRRASRTPSSAPGSTSAIPTSAARCARSMPLRIGAQGLRAWASGLRRDEALTAQQRSESSSGTRKRQMVKLNPIAAWTQDDVDAYIAEQRHPGQPAAVRRLRLDRLLRRAPGASSPGEDARAGRWAGTNKVECGLHGERRGVTPVEWCVMS